MKKLIESIENVHPFVVIASTGIILFVAGGMYEVVTTIPHGLMWIGGGLCMLSAIIAIGG